MHFFCLDRFVTVTPADPHLNSWLNIMGLLCEAEHSLWRVWSLSWWFHVVKSCLFWSYFHVIPLFRFLILNAGFPSKFFLFFLLLSLSIPSVSALLPPLSLFLSLPPSHPPGWCLQLNLANVTWYWLLLIFIMFVNMFCSSAINLPC